MSEKTNNPNFPEGERELSPEEMAQFRKKAAAYYKDQTLVLEAQFKYETLLAEIEEARAKRMTMTLRMAQMMAGPPKESEVDPSGNEPSPENTEERPARKLKTQE